MIGANNSTQVDAVRGARPAAVETTRKVGVVIVNFFTADYLRRCLLALARQTRPADSVIVIDNGDRPGALDFIAQEFPAIRVLARNNVGFAAANNLAIAELKREQWIALLNPDAFPEPDWLEQLLLAAKNHPEYSVFSSQLLQADNTLILDGDGDSYHVSGLAWRHNHGRPARYAGQMREVFSACAAAALYRRDALLEVEGFDPAYFCYFEDIDLGFRLRLRGYRCLQVPAAKVRHVGSGASNGEKCSDFALYHGHRNLVWTFVKNMPGYLFWVFLPVHLLLNVVEIAWFSCRGRGGVICRAKMDALKGMPTVWAQRKMIQAQRMVAPASILRLVNFWPFTLDR